MTEDTTDLVLDEFKQIDVVNLPEQRTEEALRAQLLLGLGQQLHRLLFAVSHRFAELCHVGTLKIFSNHETRTKVHLLRTNVTKVNESESSVIRGRLANIKIVRLSSVYNNASKDRLSMNCLHCHEILLIFIRRNVFQLC